MRLLFLLLILCFSGILAANQATPTRIAAAADLQLALTELAQQFRSENPDTDLRITFGSSGLFATQLRQGAPFELYFSANAEYVRILFEDGLTLDEGIDYASGRLAFYTRDTLHADTATLALMSWHQQARSTHKLSIANPRHAPYGVAAIGWLNHVGMGQELQHRLVLGENAAQSVQFVLSGAAQSGIVAWPLIASRDDLPGTRWLIPEDQHPTLQQRMVLMKDAGPVAHAFYHYVQTDMARQVLNKHGFGAP